MWGFRLDSLVCSDCKQGFFATPPWFVQTEAGTRSVWRFVVYIHAIYLLIFPFVLDGGVLSYPASIYSLAVLGYIAVRFGIARFKGFPILTRLQALGLLALPAYGLAGFLVLFYFVQRLRYDD